MVRIASAVPSVSPEISGKTGHGWFCDVAGATLVTVQSAKTINMSEAVNKEEVISQYKTHDSDTGSSDVQIALLSARISHLTDHLRVHRKDFHSRRGLLALASRRRKLLDYVKKHDLERYNTLLQRLGLRR